MTRVLPFEIADDWTIHRKWIRKRGQQMKQLIDKLYHTGRLLPDEFRALLSNRNDELYGYLSERPERPVSGTMVMMCISAAL